MDDMPGRVALRPFVQDADVTVYCGDALETLRELPSESVDAIVTSPPYADLRNYGGCAPDDYPDWISPVLSELLRVIAPEGSLMLNLGRIFRGGEEHPYPLLTVLRARELGWKHIDTIIWSKPNALPLKAPTYLHDRHEYVWWLAADTKAYRGFTAETRTPHAASTIARYERTFLDDTPDYKQMQYRGVRERKRLNPDGARPGSVFTAYVGKLKGISHTAPMAEDLARYLVALSCPPGGTVLDPYLGSGTTAIAARHSQRKAIGIELNPEYAAMCAKRLQQLSLLAG